jgi:DNA-binding transcriptional regulator of glucitol operon
MTRLITLVVIVWLAVGAVAAGQRHYYTNPSQTCAHVGTVAVTILAGPLNYTGVNPKVSCRLPTPST